MAANRKNKALLPIFEMLHRNYGGQAWWPADSAFEVMVGAVLTQNTAWRNVERAIANLRSAGLLDPHAIVATPHARLAAWLRPAGYFNVKAERLRSFCHWFNAQGGYDALATFDTPRLRAALLAVMGIGPETADDILLYAFERPIFVIDAYTRRLFSRLGFVRGDETYETLRVWFETVLTKELQRNLGADEDRSARAVTLFNEYHALIVNHAKDVCKKRPRCAECVLAVACPSKAAAW